MMINEGNRKLRWDGVRHVRSYDEGAKRVRNNIEEIKSSYPRLEHGGRTHAGSSAHVVVLVGS